MATNPQDKRTIYKLIKKNGDKQRVKNRKLGERLVEDSLYRGLIRERQEKFDGAWLIDKVTILKDKDGVIKSNYNRKAESSDLEVYIDE